MYRITRPLNHNALLAFDTDEAREYLVVGKGVGFGRKPGERVQSLGNPDDLQLYLLSQQVGGRGTPRELIERIDPTVLDIAEDIHMDARLSLGHIDPNMLLPLADHLAFAVARVRGGAAVSNPLTEDIRALFPREFEVAHRGVSELERRLGIVLGDDETGLIALHVHSALDSGHVEQAMQVAQLTRACIDAVERLTGAEIDVSSMDYGYAHHPRRTALDRRERDDPLRGASQLPDRRGGLLGDDTSARQTGQRARSGLPRHAHSPRRRGVTRGHRATSATVSILSMKIMSSENK